MRVSVVIAALAVVASARSLGRRQDDPPQCALDCVAKSESKICDSASPDVIACYCKDPEVVKSVEQCVHDTCKEEDLEAAIKAACDLCEGAGAPLDQCKPPTA